MKIKHFGLILFVIAILLIFEFNYSIEYRETSSRKETRAKFIKKYSNQITKGKISYEYSEEKGTYCRANSDLYKSEITMTISRDFIICGCNINVLNFS